MIFFPDHYLLPQVHEFMEERGLYKTHSVILGQCGGQWNWLAFERPTPTMTLVELFEFDWDYLLSRFGIIT